MPAIACPLLTLTIVVVTLIAFRNQRLTERLIFRPERVLVNKEWYRMFSCALLHGDFPHLAFNMLGFYMFGLSIEQSYGPLVFLMVALVSQLGALLLSLFLHRNHEYAAVGASGSVSGVIFACIFLVPGTAVGMLFLPIAIPGPIYALGYLLITFYALRKGRDNIGHDAHFGGSVVGLLVALILAPQNCLEQIWLFGGSALICAFCLWVLIKDPMGLSGRVFSARIAAYDEKVASVRYDYGKQRKGREDEIDQILEKVGRLGIDKISKKERALLAEESQRLRK
jgi:membrane associated rhomboid family serine protease